MDGSRGTVSVIIPTYNRKEIVGDAIDSALAQTYDDIEVIVVDDGSNDGTEELIGQHGPRVDYYQLSTNRGANAARNIGVEQSSGEFIAFLDADDLWKPEKIERQVDVLIEAGDECGLVHTGIEITDFRGEQIDQRVPPQIDNVEKRLLLGNFVGTFSCSLLQRDIFHKVGLLDEGLPSWQDWEFYLRVAEEFDFIGVPDTLTTKRAGRGDQISRNIDPLVNETYPLFWSIISERADRYGPLFRRRALAMLNEKVGDAALMNDRIDIAREFLFQGLRLYPLNPKLVAYCLLSVGGTDFYRFAIGMKRRLRI